MVSFQSYRIQQSNSVLHGATAYQTASTWQHDASWVDWLLDSLLYSLSLLTTGNDCQRCMIRDPQCYVMTMLTVEVGYNTELECAPSFQ